MSKTPWQRFLDRKTQNIGFITKTGAFRDPTPAEKHAALLHEIGDWQASKGKRIYSISDEYSVPKGFGINLKEDPSDIEIRKAKATKAYVETPMMLEGKFKDAPIDLSPYKMNKLQKAWAWVKTLFHREPDHQYRTRIREEVLRSFPVKEDHEN